MNDEIWKAIKGYEGLYEISNLGRVRSLYKKGKILSTETDKKGYLKLKLSKNRNRQFYLISRLVAEAFIPNPDNKPEVDHINTNPSDNRAENLRWVTHKENCSNPLTQKHYLNRKGSFTTYTKTPIVQYSTFDNQPIAWWNSLLACSKFTGITPPTICCNLKGKTKTVCNREFYFKYQ